MRSRVARWVRRATVAGISAELIIQGVRELLFSIERSDLTPEQAREAEQRFRDYLQGLEAIDVTQSRRYPEGLGGPIVINERPRPGGMRPPRWEQLPPGAPPGGGAPPSSSGMPTVRSRARRLIRDYSRELVIGGIGLGIASLIRRVRSGSQTQTVNLPNVPGLVPPGIVDTPPAPTPQPLTVVQGGMLPSSARQTCECKDQRRKKRRKCLERADVVWKTGRYKGKPAGRRCVRFAKE